MTSWPTLQGQPLQLWEHLIGADRNVYGTGHNCDARASYFQALLAAMKQALHHLEGVKLFRHDDPELSELKQVLKGKIEEFESDDSMELESTGAD